MSGIRKGGTVDSNDSTPISVVRAMVELKAFATCSQSGCTRNSACSNACSLWSTLERPDPTVTGTPMT
eukprot:11270933-Alexandrium_andersonii.AAC.1